MEVYWFKHCPRCGPEGELAIVKSPRGALWLRCLECCWSCANPKRCSKYKHGFEGVDSVVTIPTDHEIDHQGWRRYCLSRMEIDPIELNR